MPSARSNDEKLAGDYQLPKHLTQSSTTLVNEQGKMPWSESPSEPSTKKDETERPTSMLKPVSSAPLNALKQRTATALLSVADLQPADQASVRTFASQDSIFKVGKGHVEVPGWKHQWTNHSEADLINLANKFSTHATVLYNDNEEDESHAAQLAAQRLPGLAGSLDTGHSLLTATKADISSEINKWFGRPHPEATAKARTATDWNRLYTAQWVRPSKDDYSARDKEAELHAFLGIMQLREEQDRVMASSKSVAETGYSEGDSKASHA